MDRFIDNAKIDLKTFCDYLKSNMDRFIGLTILARYILYSYLKSNMDRFIVAENIAQVPELII